MCVKDVTTTVPVGFQHSTASGICVYMNNFTYYLRF